MEVLIVEDVPEVTEAIRMCFTMRWPNATVLASENGHNALTLMESGGPDIVVLDLGLPDMNRLDLLKEIRQFSDTPVIIVTGDGQETAKVAGLELGADDYVVKPFSQTELMARAKAVLRRSSMPELRQDQGLVNTRDLAIDVAGRYLSRHGEEVKLTATEWRFLSYLVRNERKVISHQVLAEKVWGTEFLNGSAIKMCVRRLRMKLGDSERTSPVLRTHRGMGYSFARPL